MRHVLVALLLVASTANSEDWQQIGKLDSEGGILLVDAAGIAEVKGLRRAWFKAVYTSDQPGAYFYQELLTFRAVPPDTLDEQMLETVCNFAGDFADAEAAKLRLPGEEAKKAKLTSMVNPDDYYPPGSRRRREQGSPIVQVCVDPSGKLLREPAVMDSSGFTDLDGAAIEIAKANRYAAGSENGKVLAESCLKFKVKFALRKK